MKITHFHESLKPIQLKCRHVPLHLLDSVKTELNRLKKRNTLRNWKIAMKIVFFSPIVITCKKDKLIKLALDSKFINNKSSKINTKGRTFMKV